MAQQPTGALDPFLAANLRSAFMARQEHVSRDKHLRCRRIIWIRFRRDGIFFARRRRARATHSGFESEPRKDPLIQYEPQGENTAREGQWSDEFAHNDRSCRRVLRVHTLKSTRRI